MPVTNRPGRDVRLLVVREQKTKRTDIGVWFALSLAFIFVDRGTSALLNRLDNV